ncbi:MAG: hypothetical protein A2219_04335 [Elusimicrobia bacterium RIFOXYA2_FULL_50_26]|nr:MAG: hypothetical protein A2219_04335 [Elusimicrobia bacterium RIFOXYA2_FULL_50_26]
MSPCPPFSCNLCGKGRYRIMHASSKKTGVQKYAAMTTDFYGIVAPVVACTECGLVTQYPLPAISTIENAYRQLEDNEYLLEDDCRSMTAHLSLMTIKRHVKKGTLLDVGCATGIFINAAGINFEVCGIEPSEWSARVARTALGEEAVITGTIETAPIRKAAFDVVTFIDVIEHLHDPKAAIAKAKTLLKPGGLLYLVTPNVRSLSAMLLGRYWWGYRPAHLYYFSVSTMQRLLEENGFVVTGARSFGRIFTYDYWLSRLAGYPRPLRAAVSSIIKLFDINNKPVYIDTRDSMEMCAVKRD